MLKTKLILKNLLTYFSIYIFILILYLYLKILYSMSNYVTIGYLKDFTKGVIKINSKGSSLSDGYVVSYDEIVNGEYFTYFKDNETNPKSIVAGLYVPYNDITSEFVSVDNLQLIFPKMMSLMVECDDVYISPCGGSVELDTMVNINLMVRTINGESVIRKITYEVNPILRKEENEFTLEKHTVSIDANLTDEDRSTIVTASYSFRNVLKNASIEIIQESNELSDWRFDYNTTDSISISACTTVFSNEGGSSTLTVKRCFTSHYYKEDSCGNKVATSAVSGNYDDVSRICQYDSTNGSVFKRSSNVITVGKQSVDASERHCIVFAEYDGCNDSITLKQEKGSSSSYDYTLKFLNENEYAVRSLTTSLPTEFTIPLISTTNLYINGEYINSIPYYDLKFVKYDDWYDAFLDEDAEEISIIVNVKESNPSKEFDRETELEIYNANDVTNRIRLLIKQPKNKLIRSDFKILTQGNRYFNVETIKTSKIEVKPLKIEYYEDGTSVESHCLDESHKIVCDWTSSDKKVLEGRLPKLIDFNGTHIFKPIYHNVEVNYEVNLCVTSYIVDEDGKVISNKLSNTIELQGVDITTYEYVFEYEDGSLYKEFEWESGDLNRKDVNVICKKQHYVNGIYDCEYEIPFKFKLNNDKIDSNFSMNIHRYDDNDNVEKFFIYPNMDNCTENDVVRQYTLIQKESNKELQLNLIQHPLSDETHIDLDLNVLVHSKDISDDVWTDEESVLIVTDITDCKNVLVKEIPLSLCWLYEGIDNDCDYLHSGKIDLIVGHEYNFKCDNVIKLIYHSKDSVTEYNLNETYVIEDDDEGIDIIIEI